jgi:hypothetical protein
MLYLVEYTPGHFLIGQSILVKGHHPDYPTIQLERGKRIGTHIDRCTLITIFMRFF